MSIAEEEREVATNWRDYLRDTRESLRVFGWVWRELISSDAKKHARRALVFIVISMTVSMAAPFVMGKLIDGLVSHEANVVIMAFTAFVAFRVVGRILGMFYDRHRERAINMDMAHVDVRLSEMFFEKSLGQHMREDDSLSAANIEKGRGRVAEIEGLLLFDGLPSLIQILVSFILLCLLSLTGGAMMLSVLVFYLVWLVLQNRRILAEETPIDNDFRRLMRYRFERWDGVERVKTSGKEAEEIAYLKREFTDVMRRESNFWISIINVNTLRGIINGLVVSAVVGYGVWHVWEGVWTVGLLMPLISWTQQFGEKLWLIGGIERRLNRAMPSVKAMMEALTAETEVQDKPDAHSLKDESVEVTFNGVAHAYNASGDTETSHVLRNVDLTVRPGEKVALIGESGAGKTTIMRLLQRYFDPTEGAVLINGVDLRDIKLESWRHLTAYIPQQALIFNGTLRENFLYGLPEEEQAKVPDETLLGLMKMVLLDGSRFKEGLGTVVGRNGIKLSGGESQRVMIIAAIVQSPRFLIVDEATSSLDSTTEKEVQAGLEHVLEASTSALIITHRLPTVRNICTKFIVLRPAAELGEGECQVEAVAGSFEALYGISPTFKRLADDQGVPIRTPLLAKDIPANYGNTGWWNN